MVGWIKLWKSRLWDPKKKKKRKRLNKLRSQHRETTSKVLEVHRAFNRRKLKRISVEISAVLSSSRWKKTRLPGEDSLLISCRMIAYSFRKNYDTVVIIFCFNFCDKMRKNYGKKIISYAKLLYVFWKQWNFKNLEHGYKFKHS